MKTANMRNMVAVVPRRVGRPPLDENGSSRNLVLRITEELYLGIQELKQRDPDCETDALAGRKLIREGLRARGILPRK